MEPIDYINKFRMTEEGYEFNREDFIREFSKEFLDYLQKEDRYQYISYNHFREILSSFNSKFKAISQLKAHLRPDYFGLSQRLWGIFYVHTALPERARRFPKEHRKILNHRRTRQNICQPK